MNKILLIIQREYLSRVKKKSFLLVTFLVPVLFIGMMALTVYLSINQSGLADKKKVLVVDDSKWFEGKLKNSKVITYSYSNDYKKARQSFKDSDYDYLLYIPSGVNNVLLLGEKTPSAMNASSIENQLTKVAQEKRLGEAHIDTAILAKAQQEIKVEAKQITADGEKDAHIWSAYAVGLICAFIIYITLFLYGAQVMRGVIEEKVSRIAEVIISSVKPFQLMLGKILGVGMVGLTQFILWIVLTLSISTVAGTAFISKTPQAQALQNMSNVASSGQIPAEKIASSTNDMSGFMSALENLPVTTIVVCFIFYFFFGYMLYSALFAAIGSAVDNETETQQFMVPITLPLIATIMVSQTVIVNNPDSSLSVWLSIIPFTSPIAMMIRIPFGVPMWQVAVSMVSLIAGFIFTTWVAGRIYRVGILMHGKKASYKELIKWFSYKD